LDLWSTYRTNRSATKSAHGGFLCSLTGNTLERRNIEPFTLQRNVGSHAFLTALRGFRGGFGQRRRACTTQHTGGGLLGPGLGQQTFCTKPTGHSTQGTAQTNLFDVLARIGLCGLCLLLSQLLRHPFGYQTFFHRVVDRTLDRAHALCSTNHGIDRSHGGRQQFGRSADWGRKHKGQEGTYRLRRALQGRFGHAAQSRADFRANTLLFSGFCHLGTPLQLCLTLGRHGFAQCALTALQGFGGYVACTEHIGQSLDATHGALPQRQGHVPHRERCGFGSGG
jgi:hypothetical protein